MTSAYSVCNIKLFFILYNAFFRNWAFGGAAVMLMLPPPRGICETSLVKSAFDFLSTFGVGCRLSFLER